MKKYLILSFVFVVASFTFVSQAFAAPEFAFTAADGSFKTYTSANVDDAYVKATITEVTTNQWKLDITPKQNIKDLYFPWQQQRASLNGNLTDDIYYYPYIMGLTLKATAMNTDFAWWVPLKYPGGAGLPLTVIADNSDGRVVAAINWPPKTVIPMFGAERQVLQYPITISAGTTQSFGALIAKVSGNASTGSAPWQLALDPYKNWLNANMGQVNYPAWMWDGDGIFDLQLQNNPQSSGSFWNTYWQPYKATYPWVQMWGQMGAYAVACCGLGYDMYAPYTSNIPDWVKNTIVAGGYHAGYYSAPYYNDDVNYAVDKPAGVNWITGWISKLKNSYYANAFYLDTYARGYWGDAVAQKQLFDSNTIPLETMLEGAVDMYPRAGLISGALMGDANGCGAPFKRPETSTFLSYPNFMRYVLADRLLYQGAANTDWAYYSNWKGWGNAGFSWCPDLTSWCAANGPCEYGSERLAFLLGTKIDAMELPGSTIQQQIAAERARVNWWSRRPAYLDTRDLNLTTIPASSKVEVSHFKDKNGADLLAVSNPNGVSGLSFKLAGQTFNVPTKAISVLEAGSITPTPSPAPAPAPTPTPTPPPATFLKGDINKDGIVNSLDWSLMNNKWFTSDTSADLNADGIINSLDFSLLNSNWLKTS